MGSVAVVGAILFGSIALVGLLFYVGHVVVLSIASPLLLTWQGVVLLGLFLLVGVAVLLAQIGCPGIGGHLLVAGFFVGVIAISIFLGKSSGIMLFYLVAVAAAVALFDLRTGVGYAFAGSVACLLTSGLERAIPGIPILETLPTQSSNFILTPFSALLTTSLLILYTARRTMRLTYRLDQIQAASLEESQQRESDHARLESMERLLAIGKVLNSTLKMEEVLTLILDRLKEVVSYDSACILLLTPSCDTLTICAAHGYKVDLLKAFTTMHLGDFSTFRLVIENASAVIVEDTQEDPRWVKARPSEHIQSWLGIPMIARDEVIGALSIDFAQFHEFSPDEITAAEAFAEQAAVAVQNARLYQSLAKAHEELQKLDEQRAEYYSLVIHDMRTPLTVALGYLELLLDPVEGEMLTESQHFMLTQTRESLDRVIMMVNDFMDYSKIEAGFLELNLKEIDMISLIDNTFEDMLSAAEGKGVALTWKAPPPGFIVEGDPKRLRQVIENLLVNAVKYTNEGGSVEVRIGKEGNDVLVEVQDTGIGIPLEMQPLLFGAYRAMVGGKLARVMRGTGLGLFIVKRVVEAHDGRVGVHSTGIPGEGSTFYFTLPLASRED